MKELYDMIGANNKEIIELKSLFLDFKNYGIKNNIKYLYTDDFMRYIKENSNLKLKKDPSEDNENESKNLISLFYGKKAALDSKFEISGHNGIEKMELNVNYTAYIDHGTFGTRSTIYEKTACIEVFLDSKIDFSFLIEGYRNSISIMYKDLKMDESFSEALAFIMDSIINKSSDKKDLDDILLLNYDFDIQKSQHYDYFYDSIKDLSSYIKKVTLVNKINNKKTF